MHKKIVANIVARVVLVVCGIMLIPLAWAVYDGPRSHETAAFLETIVFGSLLSLLVMWVFRADKVDYARINAKDGLAVVGLSWIALSAVGACPLYLSRITPYYIDALFEIVSGFTTTGASIFSDVESLPRGILFWRSLTQWLGGMGIIVLYLALLPALGINAYQLYKAEAPGITVDRIEPRIKETAKALWRVYFLLTITETALLCLCGMPVFDSLCHTFATIATGGFSTKNASIGAYNSYIQWIVVVFMFLSGINFMLHYQALRGDIKTWFKNEEFKFYSILILCIILLFTWRLASLDITDHPLRDSAFQVLTVSTSTGFATANFNLWPPALQLTMIFLMIMGGCGGSTSGGMKVARVFLAVKIALRSGIQAIFPNAILPIKFNKAPLQDKLITAVLSYCVIYVVLLFIGALILTITDACDIATALSAAAATFGNVGPGIGLVGPTANYGWLSIPGKLTLIFLMLAGRLELYAILILFLPSSWKK